MRILMTMMFIVLGINEGWSTNSTNSAPPEEYTEETLKSPPRKTPPSVANKPESKPKYPPLKSTYTETVTIKDCGDDGKGYIAKHSVDSPTRHVRFTLNKQSFNGKTILATTFVEGGKFCLETGKTKGSCPLTLETIGAKGQKAPSKSMTVKDYCNTFFKEKS